MPVLLQSLFLDWNLFGLTPFSLSEPIPLPFSETAGYRWTVLKLVTFKGHIQCLECVIEYCKERVSGDMAAFNKKKSASLMSCQHQWILDYEEFYANQVDISELIDARWLLNEFYQSLEIAVLGGNDLIGETLLKLLTCSTAEGCFIQSHNNYGNSKYFGSWNRVRDLIIVSCHRNAPACLRILLRISEGCHPPSDQNQNPVDDGDVVRRSGIKAFPVVLSGPSSELWSTLFRDACSRGFHACGIILYEFIINHNYRIGRGVFNDVSTSSNFYRDTISLGADGKWTPPAIILSTMPASCFHLVVKAVTESFALIRYLSVPPRPAQSDSRDLSYADSTVYDLSHTSGWTRKYEECMLAVGGSETSTGTGSGLCLVNSPTPSKNQISANRPDEVYSRESSTEKLVMAEDGKGCVSRILSSQYTSQELNHETMLTSGGCDEDDRYQERIPDKCTEKHPSLMKGKLRMVKSKSGKHLVLLPGGKMITVKRP
jgi:hypothetical protein